MFSSPAQFEPLIIGEQRPGFQVLLGLASELTKEAACLHAVIPLATQMSVAQLVTGMNCYYSNLIEGHHTLPLSIESALKRDFTNDRSNAAHQSLALAHILAAQWAGQQTLSSQSMEGFILETHRRFCQELPSEMLILEDGRVMPLGVLRDGEVIVGQHVAPASDAVPQFMDRFSEVFGGQLADSVKTPYHQLIATMGTMAAHHRFVWIHPFFDGNGRVARILQDVMLRQIGVNHAGLWSMSRGLAKREKDYKALLAGADSSRQGDLDGRGNLSESKLVEFCKFSLEVAIDQVQFMRGMFEFNRLEQRAKHYFKNVRLDMKPESAELFVAAVMRGEIDRGEAPRITGLKERTARDVIAALIKDRFLISDTPKGKLRAGFPVIALGTLLPNLYPSGDVDMLPE